MAVFNQCFISGKLPSGFDQLPFGDQLLGTGGHLAEFADNFQLLRLSRLGELALEMGKFLMSLAATGKFSGSFTGSHEFLLAKVNLSGYER